MRSTLLLLGALLVTLTPARAQQQFQILASVVDANGAVVSTLASDDVRVLENGAQGKVVKVEPIDRKPTLQILVDNGVGLGGENLIHLRNGLRGLIEALPEGLEVTLVSTAPQPRFVVRATTDRQALLQGVDRVTPDSGAGRFVESLNEATQRIEREKSATAPVIISAATTSGDTNVMERDIERLMKRLQEYPTTVHVVVFSGGVGRSASGGGNQTEVGLAVTKFTAGRYENINAGSRLATLLPELGAEVAKGAAQQSRQFRLTVERPEGAKGQLGSISMGTRSDLKVVKVQLDGSGAK
jgi:hypothetical protein